MDDEWVLMRIWRVSDAAHDALNEASKNRTSALNEHYDQYKTECWTLLVLERALSPAAVSDLGSRSGSLWTRCSNELHYCWTSGCCQDFLDSFFGRFLCSRDVTLSFTLNLYGVFSLNTLSTINRELSCTSKHHQTQSLRQTHNLCFISYSILSVLLHWVNLLKSLCHFCNFIFVKRLLIHWNRYRSSKSFTSFRS